jgi:hypothetical protein
MGLKGGQSYDRPPLLAPAVRGVAHLDGQAHAAALDSMGGRLVKQSSRAFAE